MMASQIFSSVGIGALIGILLGLSSAPVVGLVVGSITALLASIIGLKSTDSKSDSGSHTQFETQLKLAGIRTGTFGLACVLGIFIGIYMRTHNSLSPAEPSLEAQLSELVQIGFSPNEARNILLTSKLSLENLAKRNDNASTEGSWRQTILFATDTRLCEKINVNRFANFNALISAYETMELTELSAIASAIDKHVPDESTKLAIVRATVERLCSLE